MQPPPELPATVVKSTLKGEIVYKIQGPPDIPQYKSNAEGTGPAPYNPTNIAIAPNGDLYVADGYGSYYINRYNAKGEYLSTFGGRGSDPGLMREPHGIWIDTRSATPNRHGCRSPQQPAAAIHARRQAHRLRRQASACPVTSTSGTASS